MAKAEPSYYALTLLREDSESIPLTYRPRDKTLPPYVITGQPVEMRIKPKGAAEIVYNSAPNIAVTDGANGEITIAIPSATKAAYTFQNASYAVLLNGKRLFYGDLTLKSIYE